MARGAGGRTRTYEADTARDLQSLVIATRRLQRLLLIIAEIKKRARIFSGGGNRAPQSTVPTPPPQTEALAIRPNFC